MAGPSLYRLELDLPGLADLRQKQGHWRTRAREAAKWRALVRLLTGHRRPTEPLQRARVTITRCSSVQPDWDNMVAAGKPIVDGLIRSGPNLPRADVLVDDSPDVIVERSYLWELAPKGKGHTRVVVEEV